MSEPRKTPLYEWHRRQGGRIVDFAGWLLPIHYRGVLEEHLAVRERAGLFDVSHMGEIRLRGPGALALVQRLTVNDAAKIVDGQAQYTAMVDETGGVIDDLLVYRLGEEDLLLVVNAATTAKDLAWIQRHAGEGVEVTDESGEWAQLALQGPVAADLLAEVLEQDLDDVRYYRFREIALHGRPAIVSRTGYTGEDGFELYLAPELAPAVADAILERGAARGVIPAGLGARDTLRLEAGMLLYGSDMDERRTPIEAGLSWIVKLDKGEFVGRDALVRQRDEGTAERLVGVRMIGRGIPRHGYAVLDRDGGRIGEVTSGTFSPTLKEGIALAYVKAAAAEPDQEVAIEIRGRAVPARVVKPPFYRRPR